MAQSHTLNNTILFSLLFVLLSVTLVNAQEEEEIEETVEELELDVPFDAIIESTLKGKRTKFYGETRLNLNQISFSNWISGGASSLSGLFGVDYHADYSDRNGLVWNSNFILSVGTSSIAGTKYNRKADDRLQIESLVGKQINPFWKFSGDVKFRTQLFPGYRFFTENGEEKRTRTTQFFAPAQLQLGVGFYYKKIEEFWINLSPMTARVIYVAKKFTRDIPDGTSYLGVDKGQNSKFFLGFSVNGYYKVQPMDNVTVENRFNFYSNYLNNFKNIDFEINTIVRLKVNEIISGTIDLHAIYDDDVLQKLQFKELFGMGILIEI